jgi:hypothetical protein
MTDPDADPALFVRNGTFEMPTKTFFESTVHSHYSSKKKSNKKSQNSRNQGFSYFFFFDLLMEGSGSILINCGSGDGSRRPKNIVTGTVRIRIRTRNTAEKGEKN